MDELRRRMRRLERINLALAIGLGLACLAAARPSGDAKFDTVTARSFVVVDAEGIERGSLSNLGDGRAILDLNGGKDGGLSLSGGRTPSIHLNCEDSGAIRMEITKDGTPNLWITDPKGHLMLEVPKGRTVHSEVQKAGLKSKP